MKAGRCSGAEVVDARVSILTPAQDLPERIRRGPADVLNLVLERFRQVRNGAGHNAADQCTEPTGVAINVLCISVPGRIQPPQPVHSPPSQVLEEAVGIPRIDSCRLNVAPRQSGPSACFGVWVVGVLAWPVNCAGM